MQLTLSDKKNRNHGWVVVGTLLIIDAMVMGVMFTLGIMLPMITFSTAGWTGPKESKSF